jgi:CBS domain-containing protein
MAMKCADIMNVNLELVLETTTVHRAAEIMAEAGVGFLPICDADGRVLGVVTDRDLAVRVLAKALPPSGTTVSQVMSSPPIADVASADVRDAAELMSREQRNHLVITDDVGHPIGLVSLVDIVEKAHDYLALRTARAVLGRDALGPRGGARPNDPLLKNDPTVRALPRPSEELKVRQTVFTGGHHALHDLKEFPT